MVNGAGRRPLHLKFNGLSTTASGRLNP